MQQFEYVIGAEVNKEPAVLPLQVQHPKRVTKLQKEEALRWDCLPLALLHADTSFSKMSCVR